MKLFQTGRQVREEVLKAVGSTTLGSMLQPPAPGSVSVCEWTAEMSSDATRASSNNGDGHGSRGRAIASMREIYDSLSEFVGGKWSGVSGGWSERVMDGWMLLACIWRERERAYVKKSDGDGIVGIKKGVVVVVAVAGGDQEQEQSHHCSLSLSIYHSPLVMSWNLGKIIAIDG